MDFLKNFIANFHELSESSFNAFNDIVKFESLPKNHQIVKLG
mgnify:CR=1 FL=1